MSSRASVRKEVLQLYREIIRTIRIFSGVQDASSRDYAALLARSARKEMEEGRNITSTEEAYRRIVVGRHALHEIQQKVSDTFLTNRLRVDGYVM